ncbi:uncharacterized protein LOC110063226 [Orbicella faveolata]|uniref:uncharacterized protein LOC110063226 n=1 Tax=Orbicella faveolata TaxID=48498 RepID=UPI0009E3B01F|nr:uncharacterized protein LOC110063226 [Orbicella faveolata]
MTRVKTSIIVGRFVFFALMVTQCFFLASYPAYYEDEDAWYAVSLLFFPAVTMWWCLISIDATLYQVYIFWMLYIWLGIVPMIGIVFGKTGNKVENQGFWNANTLKMTLCITPLLHFLIRHTGIATTDSHVHVTELSEWSAKAIMNLFDGIELIAVVLDENECSYGISRHFMNTLIAFTCISFLWWPFDMLIYESYDDSVVRVLDFVQVSFDTIFLGLRLGLCLGYGKNTSIFINKNIIIVFVYSRRTFNFFFESQDSNNGSTANQQQGESRSSSASSTAPVVPANTSRSGHARVSRSSIAPLPTASAPSYEDTPLPPYDVDSPPPYTTAPPPPYSTV